MSSYYLGQDISVISEQLIVNIELYVRGNDTAHIKDIVLTTVAILKPILI